MTVSALAAAPRIDDLGGESCSDALAALRLAPARHYLEERAALRGAFAGFAAGKESAAEVNARVRALIASDPFGAWLVLSPGFADLPLSASAVTLASMLGADTDGAFWPELEEIAGQVAAAPPVLADADTARYQQALRDELGQTAMLAQIGAVLSALRPACGEDVDQFYLGAMLAGAFAAPLGVENRAAPWLTEAEAAAPLDSAGRAAMLATLPWFGGFGFEAWLNGGDLDPRLPKAVAAGAPRLAALAQELAPRLAAEYAARAAAMEE